MSGHRKWAEVRESRMRKQREAAELQVYPPPAAQGERCEHPDCKGHTGTHPEVLTLRGGRTLQAELRFTLGAVAQ